MLKEVREELTKKRLLILEDIKKKQASITRIISIEGGTGLAQAHDRCDEVDMLIGDLERFDNAVRLIFKSAV